MQKMVLKPGLILLSVLFLFSLLTNMVSSSPVSANDQGSLNGIPPLDHHVYLPLVINDVNPIPNGGFELGRVFWSEFSSYASNILILNSGFPAGVSPHDGSWAAWLGHEWWYHPQDDYIYQTITITTDKPILHFWYWIQSTELVPYNDTFKIYFYNSDPIVNWPLDSNMVTPYWAEVAIDLSAYAGITAELQFASHNDWNYGSHIFLDDISLQED